MSDTVHENFANLAISRKSRTFHAREHFMLYSMYYDAPYYLAKYHEHGNIRVHEK